MRRASLAGWPILGSIGTHVVGVAAASSMVFSAAVPVSAPPVPIDVIRVDPPPPPAPPSPPKSALTPPRLAVHPQEVPAPPTLRDEPTPTPLPSAPLREDPPRRESPPVLEGSAAPDRHLLGGSTDPLAGATGVSRSFAKGDLLLPSGGGTGGSNSGGGESRTASLPHQDTEDGGALTDFARPLGGYQTKPRYPDGARRRGIEGVTTLRFQVLVNGRVGSVSVAESAGHSDLDRAAVEAVKTWLFEPARRGKEPVTVWVTLPVRFQLQPE